MRPPRHWTFLSHHVSIRNTPSWLFLPEVGHHATPTTFPTDSTESRNSKSEIRNSKFEFAATEGTRTEHGKKSVFHPCFIRGSFFFLRTYLVGPNAVSCRRPPARRAAHRNPKANSATE